MTTLRARAGSLRRRLAARLARFSPVYFQPLEQELEPVAPYLAGRMLDAGCGSRDITAFLRRHGVTAITRYDLASADPGVVIGPIEQMPFEDASFDSVLCNAVLEHVDNAELAIREIARVVRKGGHAVVTVPFLQPHHANPGDFRRYTADGLAQLGRRAGLDVVEVLPVHSIAQTIGWILWAHASERGGVLRRAAAFVVAFVATRLWKRTDRVALKNANTFQAVFRRPDADEAGIIGTAWRQEPVPAACSSVPTMLLPDELRLLHYLAEHVYRGDGAIVDAGAFLGGSTVALADGLRRNPARGVVHSYDRFEVEDWTHKLFFPGLPVGSSFRDLYERNVAPYADLIEVHAGDIRDQVWRGGPIEILFVDIAKHHRTCDWVTSQFFPHLIPGRSLVIQQDYLYHHGICCWVQLTMEFYADYFEYVCHTQDNSVVFLNTRPIPESVLRPHTVESLTPGERLALVDRAGARFVGHQREVMRTARDHYVELKLIP